MEGRVWSCRAIPYIKSTQNFKNRFPNYTNNYPNTVYFTQSINKFLLCFSQHIHILTGTYLIEKEPLLTSQMPFVLLLLRFIGFNIHIITRTGDHPVQSKFQSLYLCLSQTLTLFHHFYHFPRIKNPLYIRFSKIFRRQIFKTVFRVLFPGYHRSFCYLYPRKIDPNAQKFI